eukprot:CAMPEP_0197589856 /NCGR_PEP_ID=MMETSP1326-20131121/10654_1 /TAXON_ID=1155430 /ORGANISM="Genus nov. species nov., Strain RCC2288" /LENGTH=303 /DNA_ID=CAMNT_0043154837 /DNA_START=347 /DNA_END=1258 /DNA_ORIENTATION=-
MRRKCFEPYDTILACFSSFGNDSLRTGFVDKILNNFDIMRSKGLHVDVKIHVTHLPMFMPAFVSGLQVNYSLNKKAIQGLKYHFAGECRYDFRKALEADAYAYYLLLENDMEVTLEHLEALCREFKYVTKLNEERNIVSRKNATLFFRPGLVRFEHMPSGTRVLPDYPFCCNAQINRVIELGGRRFVVPKNPYEGLYFLPAYLFRVLLRKHSVSATAFGFYDKKIQRKLIREYHAGLWMESFTTKIVPLDNYETHLVHHLGDKYTKIWSTPTAEEYFKAAERYTDAPIVLKVPPGAVLWIRDK